MDIDAVSNEHGDRFRQNTSEMETRYQMLIQSTHDGKVLITLDNKNIFPATQINNAVRD